MSWYGLSKESIEKRLHTKEASGLDEKEVKKRLKEHGFNQLEEGEGPSAFLVFLAQFKDFMVLVLLAATLLSGILGEYLDAIAIIAIVIMNAILGFVQERKAEKSLKALKELSAPLMFVKRDGDWRKIPSKEVVIGDIVSFGAGDRIGADIRIVKSDQLEIEESALTGESLPVLKTDASINRDRLEVADQTNMAFMGTLVTRGKGIGIVVGTGMATEMGKIAHLIQTTQSTITPLQRRLEQLGKILISCALFLTLLVVVIGIIQGHDVYKMFLAGVSLAVAAIPEGLPAIVTVALSLGVQRMIKRNAIVRKLPAVETLGCATVICSDKTGTMTKNKMTVTNLWSSGHIWDVTGTGYEMKGKFFKKNEEIIPSNEKELTQLLTFGLLCNQTEIIQENNKDILNGDPTEAALVVAAAKAGITRDKLKKQYKILKVFPFDSTRKMMSVIVQAENGQSFVVTKGAPDVLLNRTDSILWDQRKQELVPMYENRINTAIEDMAKQALRTLAVAYKPIPADKKILHEGEAENNLIFIGLQGMIDPPRDEVKDAVLECNQAGIKTVMITGDHVETAKEIAKRLNVLKGENRIMDGKTLSSLSIEELENRVEDIDVFARVSPEHKLKIVEALQRKGHIVAMTGDGVNDAPAIKASDIGISMGKTGTDVAKESSALILMDDNFATIKSAIEEGRNIYENIRKFIRYLLASNVGEILVMLFAMLLALPLPLVPIQILWVNLVTDGLPAMALGLDKAEDNVMKHGPRKANESIFARGLGYKIISRGILIGLVTLIAFLIAYDKNPNHLVYAQTTAFTTLVMAQLIHVFDCRSERSVYHRNPFGNMYLVLAVISSIILVIPVIYYEPLQIIFHTTALHLRDWMLILGLAAIPTFISAGISPRRKSKKVVTE